MVPSMTPPSELLAGQPIVDPCPGQAHARLGRAVNVVNPLRLQTDFMYSGPSGATSRTGLQDGKATPKVVPTRPRIPMEGPWCRFRREARARADDIDTVVRDGLEALDPNRPIREADIDPPFSSPALDR